MAKHTINNVLINEIKSTTNRPELIYGCVSISCCKEHSITTYNNYYRRVIGAQSSHNNSTGLNLCALVVDSIIYTTMDSLSIIFMGKMLLLDKQPPGTPSN